MSRAVLALDVGGANLKAAHSSGMARLQPFALWRDPAHLPAMLHSLVQGWPAYDLLAVAMTGELCDCFETKRQGVLAILAAVAAVAGATPVEVWRTDGRLVDLAAARSEPLSAAASNWLALAVFAARQAPHGTGLLIDVGSTTTDIIPWIDGEPSPLGRTDPDRLRAGELVYTGVRRTPLCALLDDSTAAEHFATILDAYLVLGYAAEEPAALDTADGRPATRLAAEARLARMLCADLEASTAEERGALALQAHHRQLRMLHRALARVVRRLPAPPQTIVVAGSGEFLARKVVKGNPASSASSVLSLADALGPEISQAACAFALAVIASRA